MTLEAIVIGLLLGAAVVMLVRRFYRSSMVDRTCGNCAHFDLEAGQELMRTHKAFMAASEDLAPWQMAQAHRKFEPNPEYVALRAELNDLLDAANSIPNDSEHYDERVASDAKIRELQARMEVMNPHQVASPSEQTTPDMLKLKWKDMGACEHHLECRYKSDSCSEFVALRRKTA